MPPKDNKQARPASQHAPGTKAHYELLSKKKYGIRPSAPEQSRNPLGRLPPGSVSSGAVRSGQQSFNSTKHKFKFIQKTENPSFATTGQIQMLSDITNDDGRPPAVTKTSPPKKLIRPKTAKPAKAPNQMVNILIAPNEIHNISPMANQFSFSNLHQCPPAETSSPPRLASVASGKSSEPRIRGQHHPELIVCKAKTLLKQKIPSDHNEGVDPKFQNSPRNPEEDIRTSNQPPVRKISPKKLIRRPKSAFKGPRPPSSKASVRPDTVTKKTQATTNEKPRPQSKISLNSTAAGRGGVSFKLDQTMFATTQPSRQIPVVKPKPNQYFTKLANEYSNTKIQKAEIKRPQSSLVRQGQRGSSALSSLKTPSVSRNSKETKNQSLKRSPSPKQVVVDNPYESSSYLFKNKFQKLLIRPNDRSGISSSILAQETRPSRARKVGAQASNAMATFLDTNIDLQIENVLVSTGQFNTPHRRTPAKKKKLKASKSKSPMKSTSPKKRSIISTGKKRRLKKSRLPKPKKAAAPSWMSPVQSEPYALLLQVKIALNQFYLATWVPKWNQKRRSVQGIPYVEKLTRITIGLIGIDSAKLFQVSRALGWQSEPFAHLQMVNKTFLGTSSLELLRISRVVPLQRSHGGFQRRMVELPNDSYLKKMIKQFRQCPEGAKQAKRDTSLSSSLKRGQSKSSMAMRQNLIAKGTKSRASSALAKHEDTTGRGSSKHRFNPNASQVHYSSQPSLSGKNQSTGQPRHLTDLQKRRESNGSVRSKRVERPPSSQQRSCQSRQSNPAGSDLEHVLGSSSQQHIKAKPQHVWNGFFGQKKLHEYDLPEQPLLSKAQIKSILSSKEIKFQPIHNLPIKIVAKPFDQVQSEQQVTLMKSKPETQISSHDSWKGNVRQEIRRSIGEIELVVKDKEAISRPSSKPSQDLSKEHSSSLEEIKSEDQGIGRRSINVREVHLKLSQDREDFVKLKELEDPEEQASLQLQSPEPGRKEEYELTCSSLNSLKDVQIQEINYMQPSGLNERSGRYMSQNIEMVTHQRYMQEPLQGMFIEKQEQGKLPSPVSQMALQKESEGPDLEQILKNENQDQGFPSVNMKSQSFPLSNPHLTDLVSGQVLSQRINLEKPMETSRNEEEVKEDFLGSCADIGQSSISSFIPSQKPDLPQESKSLSEIEFEGALFEQQNDHEAFDGNLDFENGESPSVRLTNNGQTQIQASEVEDSQKTLEEPYDGQAPMASERNEEILADLHLFMVSSKEMSEKQLATIENQLRLIQEHIDNIQVQLNESHPVADCGIYSSNGFSMTSSMNINQQLLPDLEPKSKAETQEMPPNQGHTELEEDEIIGEEILDQKSSGLYEPDVEVANNQSFARPVSSHYYQNLLKQQGHLVNQQQHLLSMHARVLSDIEKLKKHQVEQEQLEKERQQEEQRYRAILEQRMLRQQQN